MCSELWELNFFSQTWPDLVILMDIISDYIFIVIQGNSLDGVIWGGEQKDELLQNYISPSIYPNT